MALSYWERKHLLEFDQVVVGGGLVGHFTALHYAKAHPQARIALLERGLLPSGASTKNAGFACFGSLTELEDDLALLGADGLVELVVRRYRGLRALRAALGDVGIGYQEVGGFELLDQPVATERVAFFNDLLAPALGARPYSDVSAELPRYGFGPGVHGLVKNALEGTVDTGLLMRSLQRRVAQAGVQTFTRTEVAGWEEHDGYVELHLSGEEARFKATAVAVCTNAFTRGLLPDLELTPGRGQVLVTKPIPGLALPGSFHYNHGYQYFRVLEDGRILLGGARDADFTGEATTEEGINARVAAQLEADLHEVVAPGRGAVVDYRWSGTMAFGPHKKPVVERISPRVVLGVRLGGMGVAIGAEIGAELARMLSEK